MKKHIVCFGDSNTHGYCTDPQDSHDGGTRFNEEERWPCLLASALGEAFLIIEEGLGGRTTVFDDPLTEGLSGIAYICACLKSHAPVDLLIVMLGTNDTKDRFAASAACIGLGLKRLLQKAMHVECWANTPRILAIAPVPIGESIAHTPASATMGENCTQKSRGLAKEYAAVCEELGCFFMDANGIGQYNTIDYMHLTRKGHAALANALLARIPALLQ